MLEQLIAERRSSVRHRCNVKMLTGGESYPAAIYNISGTGLAFFLDHNLEEKTTLCVELPNLAASFWHLKAARVVHATPQQEGTWLIGTSFLQPLTDSELRDMLKAD